jgi:tetratricopeptide (TPR) repeat protein
MNLDDFLNSLKEKFKTGTPPEIFGEEIDSEALVYIAVGDEAFEENNFRKAIDYFTKAIDLDANNYYSLFKRGVCYQMLQEYDIALIDLFKSNTLSESFFNTQTIAECYLFKKDFLTAVKYFDDALTDLDKIREIDTGKTIGIDYSLTTARIYNNQATCLYHLKQFREAIEKCTLSIRIDPSYSNPLAIRASIYIAIEKYEAAIDDFTLFKKLGHSDARHKELEDLAVRKTSASVVNYFIEIKRLINDPSTQRESKIQIDAFVQDLTESIERIPFRSVDRYERKISRCIEYFVMLWETIESNRKTDVFMGIVCYNIAKAIEKIDPRINSYEFFIDLFNVVYKWSQ